MSSFTSGIKNLTIRKFARLKLWNEVNSEYFKETGWYNSFNAKAPVDKENNPQPWLSIGANKFLESRLRDYFKIFEFGSGNSTLYFSKRVQEIVSVEHDEKWYKKIKSNMPSNVSLRYEHLENGAYQNSINDFKRTFDLIIVHGRERVECAKNAIESLNDSGVIIFDDFDRERYQDANQLFQSNGFKKLEFWGMSAGSTRFKSTAFFYKTNNCLDI